jgi:hypothetical protein
MEKSMFKSGLIKLSKELIKKNKTMETDVMLYIRTLLSYHLNKEDRMELDVACVSYKTDLQIDLETDNAEDITYCKIKYIWVEDNDIMVEVNFHFYDTTYECSLCDVPSVDCFEILEQIIKKVEKKEV